MSRDYKNAGQGDKPEKRTKTSTSNVSVPGNIVGYAGAFLAGVLMTMVLANGRASTKERAPQATLAAAACEPEVITRYEMPSCPKPELNRECNDDPYKILASKQVGLEPGADPVPETPVAPPLPELQPGARYVIQVGSFRNASDADAQRFELVTRHVFETYMQSVTNDKGETWHRLNVGPFVDHERLKEVRRILESMGIVKYLLKRSNLPLVNENTGEAPTPVDVGVQNPPN